MATLLWGKVFYQDHFAGILKQEPGEQFLFTYDENYINAKYPPISYTLPLRQAPYISYHGLHSFFDNLVAEGWLEEAQTRLLGKRQVSRFELLLAFGRDCAGAVTVMDPAPIELTQKLIDKSDPKEISLMNHRASLSGVQPKISAVMENGKFRLAKTDELSTYIAKFPSRHHDDLVINEYLTMQAFKSLLPDDEIAEISIGQVEGISEEALMIKRFDRKANGEKIHFEEFTQLLDLPSARKYNGAHKEMADFIQKETSCLPTEIYRLYVRILGGILLGNTDMHFKNFAMFHTPQGLRLTPSYDQVCAAFYDYKTLALAIGGKENMRWGDLKAGNIIKLGQEFGLPKEAIDMAAKRISHNIPAAIEAIYSAKWGSPEFKDQLIKLLEKRWNGTFALIGQVLSKKR